MTNPLLWALETLREAEPGEFFAALWFFTFFMGWFWHHERLRQQKRWARREGFSDGAEAVRERMRDD